MKYICTRDYSGVIGNGDTADVAYGAEFDTIGSFIAFENKAVCRIGSQIAREYFAINDDGNGLERGAITHYFAFEHSFTEDEAATLQTKYPQFLNDGVFSQEFFDADIDTLRALMSEFGLEIAIIESPTTKVILRAVNIEYTAPDVPDVETVKEANIDWAAVFNPAVSSETTYTTATIVESDTTVITIPTDSDTTTEVTVIPTNFESDTTTEVTIIPATDTLTQLAMTMDSLESEAV